MNRIPIVIIAILIFLTAIVLNTQAGAIIEGTLKINLVKDLNLISIPCSTGFTHAFNVFASLAGSYETVYTFETSDSNDPWKSFNPSLPRYVDQDLGRVYHTKGYWLKMSEADTLEIASCNVTKSNITLFPGWNLIGWPSNESKPIQLALTSISGNYSTVITRVSSDLLDPIKIYTPTSENTSDLFSMDPFYGYWILMLDNDTLEIT